MNTEQKILIGNLQADRIILAYLLAHKVKAAANPEEALERIAKGFKESGDNINTALGGDEETGRYLQGRLDAILQATDTILKI